MSETGQRQCLPCTTCCQGWLYAEVLGNVLRAGHGCPHSKPEGCGVYETRPETPCRTYVCSWVVADSPLPDWMRPDLSGVIVLLNATWEDTRVITAIPAGQTIPEASLAWLKNYAQTHRRPLIYYERTLQDGEYSGLKRFGFGPPALRALAVKILSEDQPRLESPGPDQQSRPFAKPADTTGALE